MSSPPKVHHHLLGLPHTDAEIICSAPLNKFFHLLPVHRLFVVGDQSNHGCVICKLYNMFAQVPCRTIIYEERVQKGTEDTPDVEPMFSVMAEDETPWSLTDCGQFVKKSKTQLQRDGFNPSSSNLLTRVCRIMVLKAELKSRESSLTYESLPSR